MSAWKWKQSRNEWQCGLEDSECISDQTSSHTAYYGLPHHIGAHYHVGDKLANNNNNNNNVTYIAQIHQGRKCATTCQCQTGMFSVDFWKWPERCQLTAGRVAENSTRRNDERQNAVTCPLAWNDELASVGGSQMTTTNDLACHAVDQTWLIAGCLLYVLSCTVFNWLIKHYDDDDDDAYIWLTGLQLIHNAITTKSP